VLIFQIDFSAPSYGNGARCARAAE